MVVAVVVETECKFLLREWGTGIRGPALRRSLGSLQAYPNDNTGRGCGTQDLQE